MNTKILHGKRLRRLVIISVIIFIASADIRAQEKSVTLHFQNASIENVLKEVKKQTGMNYILNHEELPNEKISIEMNNVSVREALDQALKNIPSEYRIKDGVIILMPSSKDKNIRSKTHDNLFQTVRGRVIDTDTKMPLPGAVIVIKSIDPPRGTSCDPDGYFRIEKVPLGRHNIQISLLGYKTRIIPEILVNSGKEIVLRIELKEAVSEVGEVIVKAYKNKDKPINSMSTVSTRTFSVEEAQRYAGGFDDPSRLASAFAGVTSSDLSDNGIVIRGNAPKGLLWRLEGIEIPSPNHYSGLASIGGGGVSALSSLMLANSDFFTGAFPAEYSNAISGVFDIKLRTGNNENYEHAFQAGSMGIDISSEGPFSKKGRASYLFNYRYSTFGIINHILPDFIPPMQYQDLCFKFNFPTEKAGVFSLWGLGYYDKQDPIIKEDTSDWSVIYDQQHDESILHMGVIGLNHRIILGEKTYLNSSASFSTDYFRYDQKSFDIDLNIYDLRYIDNRNTSGILTSVMNHKFSAKHTNRSGFVMKRYAYDSNLLFAPVLGQEMVSFIDEEGNSMQYTLFSQSKLNLSENVKMNIGISGQYSHFNKEYILEPRAGMAYKLSEKQSLSFAYGKHSRLEPLNIYLSKQINNGSVHPNKDLNVTKSHHFVFAYDLSFNPDLRLKIEPYYQYLFDIPVIPDSSFSVINIHREWFVTEELSNKGTGTNIGIDLTFERFLNDGYYWLFTTSIFDSNYTGGDGIKRNTRFNSQFVCNLLFGKEWLFGPKKNKVLSVSARLNIQGGSWISPPLEDYPYTKGDEVLYDHSQAFSYRKPHKYHLNASVNYRINKKKRTSVFTLQVLNILGEPENYGYVYDYKKDIVREDEFVIIVPSISYKIEF